MRRTGVYAPKSMCALADFLASSLLLGLTWNDDQDQLNRLLDMLGVLRSIDDVFSFFLNDFGCCPDLTSHGIHINWHRS